MKQPTIAWWVGLILLIGISLLYLNTLDDALRPDELTGGDLITHQYAQVEARPSNAPGYPLYTMVGWLWFRLGTTLFSQWFNPTELLSLYSALWAVASLAILYTILLRICHDNWPIPALLTTFQAVTYFFWYYSVTTEQYTSAVFQTLLMIWLAFKWDDKPTNRTLLGMAFLSGTMLANMVTTLFILPPLLWFIFFRPVSNQDQSASSWMITHYLKQPKLILQAITVTALPLISYSYIYLRGAQHPEWRGTGEWASAWEWFVAFITIQQGRDELGPGLQLNNFITHEFPALMWWELTPIIFFGGLGGLMLLGRRRAIFLYTTLIIYAIFCWAYRFGNWYQVIIPAYPMLIIGVAAGVQTTISNLRFVKFKLQLTWGIYVVLIGLLIYRAGTNFERANQQNRLEAVGLNPGWAIIADNPATPSFLYADSAEQVALQYLQTMWNIGPGITLTNASTVQPTNQPTYLTRLAIIANPNLLDITTTPPQAIGQQLILVQAEPLKQLPKIATSINLSFGDQLLLIGWQIKKRMSLQTLSKFSLLEEERKQERYWQLTLYWQAKQSLNLDYTISIRPLIDGQLIIHNDETLIQDHQPVWGIYPTSQWQLGEIVSDVYALPIPADSQPEAVQIVIYHTTAEGFENLDVQTINLK